jgi:methionyl-tRNA formyltransferase
MGTPEFAVASLHNLYTNGIDIAAVVTVPDKPSGRGQKINFSAVKQFALDYNLPILQPDKLKEESFVEKLKSYNADLFIVVAFRMLPEIIWKMPKFGTINLHASLLPQYRGAAPINWAVINGETETGVTTFFIEKDIDTGNILFSEKIKIDIKDNAGIVHDKLMEIGANLVYKTATAIENGNIHPVQQSKIIDKSAEIKLAPKIFKDDCKIDWNNCGNKIYNLIRGLSPYPAAFTTLFNNKQQFILKIFETEFIAAKHNIMPKTIETDYKKFLKIAVIDGYISVHSLQIEGKKRLNIEEFLRGFQNITEYQIL